MELAYSPSNDILDKIIKQAAKNLDSSITYKAFNDSTTLESYLVTHNMIAGIEFDDSYFDMMELPKNIPFALRFPGELRSAAQSTFVATFTTWVTNQMFEDFQLPGPSNPESPEGGLPANYYKEGFMAVQSAVSHAMITTKDSTVQMPEILLQRYPYPPYYDDIFLVALENVLPLLLMVAFVFSCTNTVKYITVEKESQLKETMKIMGLPSWLHWSAWFIQSMMLLSMSISLVTMLLCISFGGNGMAVFQFSDWSCVWVFLFVYCISIVTFSFMISSFFSKANIASMVSGVVFFIAQLPFNFIVQNYSQTSFFMKMLSSFCLNSGMGLGLLLTMRHEATTTGLQWSNLFQPTSVDDNLSVGLTMVMLLAASFLYLLMTLYVEQMFPGDFGVPKPWNFMFTRGFWCKNVNPKKIYVDWNYQNDNDDNNNNNNTMESLECEPTDKNVGIEMTGLSKVFDKKVAVSGLSLNMFEDQITVLLGHNGAGKTTTMSMLTGMYPPTSGTAVMNGYDIRTNIDGVRESLGLCPQHNILFDELTVTEHIEFYSSLKGLSKPDVKNEINKYVNMLELKDKSNAQSSTLSGGMKRKLSVGVALCGNSKIVMCDEPTSGMDPAASRALWDLLEREKTGRTILLTTHFMDEADVLGDRIAIMAEGELKAFGSSFFLKKKFGVGYRLICVKTDKGINVEKLTDLLRKYIPKIEVEADTGTEISFILFEQYTNVFQQMLNDLEESIEKFGISSYGISSTTLEEVFLKVGSDSNVLPKSKSLENVNIDNKSNSSDTPITLDDSEMYLKGSGLIFNQIKAMLLKKFISTKRSWMIFLLQIFIPMWFMAMTVFTTTASELKNLPSLKISLDNYGSTVTVLEKVTDNNIVGGYNMLFDDAPLSRKLIQANEDFSDFIIAESNKSLALVNSHYVVGATIKESIMVAWFNNQAYHTPPLSLLLAYNAILKTICTGCELELTNKPLPFSSETIEEHDKKNTSLGLQLAFNAGFAMSFATAFFMLFYIKESTSKAKLLQFVSGVSVSIFWLVSFIWDYFIFLITLMLFVSTLAMFQQEGWSSVDELGTFSLVLLCFGIAVLPFTYLMSFLFTIPSSGYSKLLMINLFSGTMLFIVVATLQVSAFSLDDIATKLIWIFMIFPHFTLSYSINMMSAAATKLKTCSTMCGLTGECPVEECTYDVLNMSEDGIGRELLYMVSVGALMLALLIAIEVGVFSKFMPNRSLFVWNSGLGDINSIDEDVQREKERINDMPEEKLKQQNLVVKEMSKYYGNLLAVDHLNFSVEHSECFGLLGVNGAGKTSTFQMLTGDSRMSSGDAWVKGVSLKSKLSEVYKNIGYCPQFDALLDNLTGRETLTIFALLRGIPRVDIEPVITRLSYDLNFKKHIDKQIKECSGGTKRKISTALALLGNPSLIYLDEPTTGMDPGAKRQLWNLVSRMRNSGKSMVLTSHSMEECEALCTRLAIMVNGEFKCIGSTQHLKNKFSKGYLLIIKLNPSTNIVENSQKLEKIKNYVNQNFSSAILKEEHGDHLTYHMTESTLKWPTMFGIMEEAKQTLEIEDYSLGQTSLEQVFLFFTKYQSKTGKS
uniref:Putative lipid exporter abca1 n=1 Tax=Corethrella appendiculata TaxID=1370023 RepID=W4VRK6_9DIPT